MVAADLALHVVDHFFDFGHRIFVQKSLTDFFFPKAELGFGRFGAYRDVELSDAFLDVFVGFMEEIYQTSKRIDFWQKLIFEIIDMLNLRKGFDSREDLIHLSGVRLRVSHCFESSLGCSEPFRFLGSIFPEIT